MNLTSRLGLNKPDPDPVAGDFVDVQKLNDNADKIDGAISFTVCLSTARPAGFQGQGILETDTGKAYVWGGSAWLPLLIGGAAFGPNVGINTAPDVNPARRLKILQSGTNGGLSNVLIEQTGAAAASRALALKAGGEANERWWIDYDGKMQWGPGTAGGDTNLYRSAPDTLRTDDSLEVGGGLNVGGSINASGVVYHTAYSGTTDANGFLTVTHGAPWTPVAGWFITTNPASSFAQAWGIDTIGATTCRLRIANANGGALVSTAASGRLFLVK